MKFRYFFIFLFSFILTSYTDQQAFGFSNKIYKSKIQSEGQNWTPSSPQIVVFLGKLEKKITEHYKKLIEHSLKQQLQHHLPQIQFKVVPFARGKEIIEVLQDKNTIGVIWISHGLKAWRTNTTVLYGADNHPLPSNLLSAATPSLQFFAALSCHGGASLERHYEAPYQFGKLPGSHLFYASGEEKLKGHQLFGDQLARSFKKILKDFLKKESPSLVQATPPDEKPVGKLILRVKKVEPFIEPRYISVNGKIIGMLGSGYENSNQRSSFEELSYSVPYEALKGINGCHKVRILAGDISSESSINTYHIESIILETENEKNLKSYPEDKQLIGTSNLSHYPHLGEVPRFFSDCI